MKLFGVVLIVIGLLGVAWGGFTYTTREKVIDLGPVEATRDKKTTIPISPLAGGLAIVAGIVMVASGKK